MKKSIVLTLLCSVVFNVSAVKPAANVPTYETFIYGADNVGSKLALHFDKGVAHNHPLFAVWLADANGVFIQTLYVSQSVAKNEFQRVTKVDGKWQSGYRYVPAALPYWSHQPIEPIFKTESSDNPNADVDAYSGATPKGSFIMKMNTVEKLNGKYRIYVEINQPWDWNDYWTNDKFPGNKNYATSSQPAVVYMAEFDTRTQVLWYDLKPIGYSDYEGRSGVLTRDLSTLSTALSITSKIALNLGH